MQTFSACAATISGGLAVARALMRIKWPKKIFWNEYSALDYFWNVCYTEHRSAETRRRNSGSGR
jgi:hypothetical protein